MFTRTLGVATKKYLQSYWSFEGGCEVKLVEAPGKPLGCMTSWAITVHQTSQNQEGLIGFYPRFGVTVTLSAKLDGHPATDPEGFLYKPRTGFYDVRDALAAFLILHRWRILERANIDADGQPITGIVNNLIVAARPLNMTPATERQAGWWGAAEPQTQARSGSTPEARLVGYSSDIAFGQCLAMLTDQPNQY